MAGRKIKLLAAVLIFVLITGLLLPACGAEKGSVIERAAGYLLSERTAAEYVGSEWAVIGLARSGAEIPENWFDEYYSALEAAVTAAGGELSSTKYTEYSRTVLAVTALGRDARDVAGYDLTLPLCDFEAVTRQGVNGAISALLALDGGGYPVEQETRDGYIDFILSRELEKGGWCIGTGDAADPDVTGMALSALAPYRDDENAAVAIDRALARMSELQDENGGFSSWGTANAESCAMMLTALCDLGIPLDDERFVKSGRSIADALLEYDTGKGFEHSSGGGANIMATGQALSALAEIGYDNSAHANTCSLLISCATALDNSDRLDKAKLDIIPAGGEILSAELEFSDGETVHDLLKRACRENGIQIETTGAYIEGINNIYEFDCGELSGWVYSVNGLFPNFACSSYVPEEGDSIEVLYTCDLGQDVGGNNN